MIGVGIQENRIASFYDLLVRYSEPNTTALPGASYDVGWFSRQREYHLFRTVGQKPVAVGTVIVNFPIWGGEQFLDPGHNIVRAADGRSYLPPNMVLALQFYNPLLDYGLANHTFFPGISFPSTR